MTNRNLHDIAVEVLGETEKAWRLSNGENVAWFPKSQCEVEKSASGGMILTAPFWLLNEKEWI